MKKILKGGLLALMLSLLPQQTFAGNVEAGRLKVKNVCSVCHGSQGHSVNPLWPNLAGQKNMYIIKQLRAFQAGTRVDPVMSPQAKLLSKEDIENVAAYLSQIK